MEEPSVLDYVLSKLLFWKGEVIRIPEPEEEAQPAEITGEAIEPVTIEVKPEKPARTVVLPAVNVPIFAILSLGFFLMGQITFDSPNHTPGPGLLLFGIATLLLIYAVRRGQWELEAYKAEEPSDDIGIVRWRPVTIGALFLLGAFLTFGGNQFTLLNVTLWIAGIGFCLSGIWNHNPQEEPWYKRLARTIRQGEWNIRITPWALLVIVAAIVVIFFRVYRLAEVPAEAFSDQAEKLWDVADVLNGQTSIFFPRNTGREAFQMYLTAAVVLIFKTGISYLSLKIGTTIVGLITLIYVYLLGEEVANRKVGLLAMLFTGIAYWPNVITRVALRFTLYPLFVAPTLFYLLRGIRRGKRNDFIKAGIALGLGLHGYSPFRVVPILVVIAIGLYLIHKQSQGKKLSTVLGLVAVTLVSLLVFLPLLRFILDSPDIFFYRGLTRVGSVEQPLPGPVWQIFLSNTWNALKMFNWYDGEIWVHSVPDRPALDIVSGALFIAGCILLLVRYLRQRHWQDLFLLVSIPVLLMPSILSLAFPAENPALNRTAGAVIPVFLIVAMAFDGLFTGIAKQMTSKPGKVFVWGIASVLILVSCLQNYDLVFVKYDQQFRLGAWNSSEMGKVIRAFADSTGSLETSYVVPFPYWVDTRLVGINAGDPLHDYAIWPDQFGNTVDDPRAKLFIIHPDDKDDINSLRNLYPQGALSTYQSKTEGKNFLIFAVPSQQLSIQEP